MREKLIWLGRKNLTPGSSEEAARIEQDLEFRGEKVGMADVLIASTAAEAGLPVVCRDRDFEKIEHVETRLMEIG